MINRLETRNRQVTVIKYTLDGEGHVQSRAVVDGHLTVFAVLHVDWRHQRRQQTLLEDVFRRLDPVHLKKTQQT